MASPWIVPEGMTAERLRAIAQRLVDYPRGFGPDEDPAYVEDLTRWADTLDALCGDVLKGHGAAIYCVLPSGHAGSHQDRLSAVGESTWMWGSVSRPGGRQ